jgi:hypothetical protein
MKHIVLFFALIFLPIFSEALAEETKSNNAKAIEIMDGQIGTIIEIEGSAHLIKENKSNPKPLNSDDFQAVMLGDTIQTDPESKVHLLLIDNSEFTVGENAHLTIDEYIFDKENLNQNRGRFSILKGAFMFTSGLLSKNDKPDVELKTAYGSIGIRGTKVWGGILDNEEYGILVEEGEITVQTERGRIKVKEGQGTNLRGARAIPSRAKKWSPDKVQKVKAQIALKRKELIKTRIEKQKERYKNFKKAKMEKVKEKVQENMLKNKEIIKEKAQEKIKEKMQEKSSMQNKELKKQEIKKEVQEEIKKEIKENIQEKIEEKKESGDYQKKKVNIKRDSIKEKAANTDNLTQEELFQIRRAKMQEAVRQRMKNKAQELQKLPPARREEAIEKMHLDRKDLQPNRKSAFE